MPSQQGRGTRPGRPCQAGHPERIILSGLAKAGYALFLPLTRFCRIFCYHTHFQYHVIILAAPPHPKTAKSGNRRQETAILYSSKWAWSKDYTPNPCFVCNCVQKLPFTVQKCAVNLSDMKKIITNQNTHYQILTTNY